MIILGLGSNIGNREAYLEAAVAALANVLTNLRRSQVMETPALLPENAPADWDINYLNMAVAGDCDLPSLALLDEIKRIEQQLGRKDRGRWGPREIDIDILAMNDTVLDVPTLSIPHKDVLSRPFVLLPLAELAPDWCWPRRDAHYGKTARELARL